MPDPDYWTAWARSVAVEVFRFRLHHEAVPRDFAADGELVGKARNRLSTTHLSQIVLRNTAALCLEIEANDLPGGPFKQLGMEPENVPVLPTRWTDRKRGRGSTHDGSSTNEPRSEAFLGAGEKARIAAGIQAGGAEEGPG